MELLIQIKSVMDNFVAFGLVFVGCGYTVMGIAEFEKLCTKNRKKSLHKPENKRITVSSNDKNHAA